MEPFYFVDLELPSNNLTVLDNLDLLFPITKRIYLLHSMIEGELRGNHAHKSLNQLIVPEKGNFKLLLDDGNERIVIDVSTKDKKSIKLNKGLWRELYDFSEDCIILVLASDNYYEEDYIRDYDSFLSWKAKSNLG